MQSKKYINGYDKGMNKDLSPNLFSNHNYLDAEWLNPVINEGGKIGALTNPKGTIAKINLPSGHTLIGNCKLREKIILISVDGSNNTYIYSFIDDGTSNSQSPGSANFTQLYTDSGLASDEKLGYTATTKLDLVSRYENEEIQKVYFAAEGFPLRYLNTEVNMAGYTQYDFNIIPAVNLSKPEFVEYSSGNKKTGRVSYTYQLYKINGPETAFSQISESIPISSTVTKSNTLDILGSDEGDATGVGVKISIDNLDTNFSRIRILSFDYTDFDSNPLVNIIYEGAFTGSSIELIDNGTSLGNYNLSTFRVFNQFYIMPQYLAQKANILFAANIEEKYFDLDEYLIDSGQTSILTVDSSSPYGYFWDSRSYRFDSSGTALLHTSSEVLDHTLTTPSPSYDSVDYDADCLNKYNLVKYNGLYNDNPTTAQKYQSGGSVIGGSGKNVLFKFEEDSFILESGGSNHQLDAVVTEEHLGIKTNWQRDEVYRTFIQFQDYLGRKSFPKWICDVRIPNSFDSGFDSFVTESGGNVTAYNIYPEFKVSNLPENPDGSKMKWRILRVKREGSDRTVFGTALLSSVAKLAHSADIYGAFEVVPVYDYNLGTYLGPNQTNSITLDQNRFQVISPEIVFGDLDLTDCILHHMRYIGLPAHQEFDYRIDGGTWTDFATTPDNMTGVNKFQIVKKFVKSMKATYTSGYGGIKSIDDVITVSPTPNDIAGDTSFYNVSSKEYRNLNYRDSGTSTWGANGSCAVIKIPTVFTPDLTTDGITASNRSWYSQALIKKDVVAYGGDSFAARSRNIAIPASDFIYDSTSSLYHNAPYGDAPISMFDYIRTEIPEDVNERYQEILYIPVESVYNMNFRSDESFSNISGYARDVNWALTERGLVDSSLGISMSKLYQYNTVYSRDNDAEQFSQPALDASTVGTYDHRIRRSQIKFNGEYSDSWLQFLENDYLDVDSQFGEITKLSIFKDRLFFFQNTGFGVVPVGEKELIPSDTSATLALGSSGILNRYDYLSDNIGAENKEAITVSPNAIYIYSSVYNSMYKFTNTNMPLADMTGMNSWFDEYVTINSTVLSGYNPLLSEILFCFDNYVIVFNELIDRFTYLYPLDFTDGLSRFVEFDNFLYSFSPATNNNIGHKHNVGERNNIHNGYYDSSLTLIVNPGGTVMNIYDVVELLTEHFEDDGITELASTFNTIQITNNYQDTGVITLIPGTNIKRRFRTWRFNKIRDNIVSKPKVRASNIKIKFTYENTSNNQLIVHNLITNYRPSKMMY